MNHRNATRPRVPLAPCAVALLFLTAPGIARAADFTLNVPVRLHNLHPDIEMIRVVCRIYDQGGREIAASDSREVASTRWYAVSGGTLSRTVTLQFDATRGHHPSEARRYRCWMGMQVRDRPDGSRRSVPHNAICNPDSPQYSESLACDRSKPFAALVEGVIAPKMAPGALTPLKRDAGFGPVKPLKP